MRKILIASFALCLLARAAQAFPAIVYSAHDGDTVTLLVDGGKAHCRLAGVDTPEFRVPGKWADQPGAYEAHAALDTMILGRTVDVQYTGQRSYNRRVCRITAPIDGRATDVQEELVRQGWAWGALQFEPARARDPLIPVLETQARAARIGLWAEADPVPPWVWRRKGNGIH